MFPIFLGLVEFNLETHVDVIVIYDIAGQQVEGVPLKTFVKLTLYFRFVNRLPILLARLLHDQKEIHTASRRKSSSWFHHNLL